MDERGGEFYVAETLVVDGGRGNDDGMDSTGGRSNVVTAIAASAKMFVHAKHPDASSWTRSAPGRRGGGG